LLFFFMLILISRIEDVRPLNGRLHIHSLSELIVRRILLLLLLKWLCGEVFQLLLAKLVVVLLALNSSLVVLRLFTLV
jgi:hypothetical protein